MREPAVVHSTFTIERVYPHAAKKVFSAFSDPAKKRRWFAEGEGFVVDSFQQDFQVGGKETSVFLIQGGPVAGKMCRNDTWFLDIVTDQRIVIAYTMTLESARISASLSTMEFLPDGDNTLLRFTEQASFFAGADGPKMREEGTRFLLEKLGQELGAQR